MRYLEVENKQYQAGTTTGWGDFMRWVDSLDLNKYQSLVQFAEHGHSGEVEKVTDQLKAALADDAPDDSATRDVATNLLSNLRAHDGADFASVSDGIYLDSETAPAISG